MNNRDPHIQPAAGDVLGKAAERGYLLVRVVVRIEPDGYVAYRKRDMRVFRCSLKCWQLWAKGATVQL